MRKFNSITFIAIVGLVGLITISVFFIVPTSNASSANSEYEADDEQEAVNFVETVKMTTNLLADAKIAQEKHVPILLLFTQQSCGFCEIVRSDFLRPMLLNREYDSRVLIRQIEFDGDDVINFDGNKVTMDSFMEQYNVGFTPTVVFLDTTGKELTEQIIGITTVHYYGGFIDDNIELALKKIRLQKDKTNVAIINNNK